MFTSSIASSSCRDCGFRECTVIDGVASHSCAVTRNYLLFYRRCCEYSIETEIFISYPDATRKGILTDARRIAERLDGS